jgi:hypothetical protein
MKFYPGFPFWVPVVGQYTPSRPFLILRDTVFSLREPSFAPESCRRHPAQIPNRETPSFQSSFRSCKDAIGKHIQPIEEILAESPIRYGGFQVAIRGSDNANVDLDRRPMRNFRLELTPQPK